MLSGVCTCGNSKWTLKEKPESVTACNCNLCRRYGALWAYGHFNQDIHISGNTKIYLRPGKVSEYNFCAECGCMLAYVVVKPNADGSRKAAVNLRMIDDAKTIENLAIDHFDGFDTFEDLPRDGRTVKDLWF